MPDFKMISELPDSSLEGGIALLNSYEWNIRVEQRGKRWLVLGGHCQLFWGDSKAEVESFLYGLSLGIALLPPEAAQAVKTFVRQSKGE